jgi:hypothetical protein
MSANTSPISPLTPAAGWAAPPLTAANTALDGTGTVGTIGTAAGVNGRRVNRVRVVHLGSNVATVLRIFMNNGSSNAVAANNTLLAEETIAVNTISQVGKSVFYDIYINAVLPAGYKLNYTIGTAVASGHSVSDPDAGDY